MNLRSLTLIAFAAITSPAYADEAMTVAKNIVSKWETAYNSGNAGDIANLYVQDAVFSSGVLGVLKGKSEIEKALAEHGDKVDASQKTAIEAAAAALKEAVKGDDTDDIKAKTNALAQASMKLGEAMYKAQQAEAGGTAPDGEAPKADDNVVDADFEEVEDDKKGAA